MKLLFDLTASQPRGKTKYHGGGEYAKKAFITLAKSCSNTDFFAVYFRDRYLDDEIVSVINENSVQCYQINEYKDIHKICDENSIDVFYSALPVAFEKRPVSAKVMYRGTIHGLRGLECPGDKYSYMYYQGISKLSRFFKDINPSIVRKYHHNKLKKTIESLDEFVCVSDHTKHAIDVNYSCSNCKGVLYTPSKSFEYCKETVYSDKFILIISANRWQKNAYRAIRAIDLLFLNDKLIDYNVKVVGKLPAQIKKCIHNIGRFDFFEYVKTEELEQLYHDCELFVYPTLNEGFGMPPLEAMKYGRTCVISAVTSLPEIYGDAVYYFNPYDIREMMTRISQAADSLLDEKKVFARVKMIMKKQESDLQRLCDFICGRVEFKE